MSKNQKAKEYAASVIGTIQEAIEHAYEKGYDDKSSEDYNNHVADNIEYYDFGLPSKKKWGLLEDTKTFRECIGLKLMLPTKDDIEELLNNCEVKIGYHSTNKDLVHIKSYRNGNELNVVTSHGEPCVLTWVRTNSKMDLEGEQAQVYILCKSDSGFSTYHKQYKNRVLVWHR